MKNKGQVLVAFLLLLPILFFLLAMVVDKGIEEISYKKVKETVMEVLSFGLTENASLEEMEQLFIKNGFSKEEFTIQKKDEKYFLKVVFTSKTFFGKMWKKDTKEILNYIAYQSEEQIVIQRTEE